MTTEMSNQTTKSGISAQAALWRTVEAFNRADVDAYAAQYSLDAVDHDPMYPEPLQGREAIAADMASLIRAFPDMQVTVRSAIENGNQAALAMSATGTHTGPLESPDGDIPPTGRTVTFSLCTWVAVNTDGLIVEEWNYYDVATILTQLGLT